MSSWESAGAFLGWMGKLREKHLGLLQLSQTCEPVRCHLMEEPRQGPRWLSTGWPHLGVMGTPEIEILEILDHGAVFEAPASTQSSSKSSCCE